MKTAKQMPKRLYEMSVTGGTMKLPFYFPSISSVKANLGVLEYLQFLEKIKYPGFLISAYDIFHSTSGEKKKIYSLIKKATQNGQTVLMDSGNYECYWLKNH